MHADVETLSSRQKKHYVIQDLRYRHWGIKIHAVIHMSSGDKIELEF